MSSPRRLQKTNKHIQRVFGEILAREADLPPDVLVTITRVELTPNLKSVAVWISVYPEAQAEAVLAQLTPQLYDLQGSLNIALDSHPLPRVRLRIDYGPAHAEKIHRTLHELGLE